MDPITDLVETLQIVCVVHARLEATAPWGLKTGADVTEEVSKRVTPSENRARFVMETHTRTGAREFHFC